MQKTIADFKAVSLNVMHSSMDITDEVYSQLGDIEVQNRISSLSKDKIKTRTNTDQVNTFKLFQEFLAWWESRDRFISQQDSLR